MVKEARTSEKRRAATQSSSKNTPPATTALSATGNVAMPLRGRMLQYCTASTPSSVKCSTWNQVSVQMSAAEDGVGHGASCVKTSSDSSTSSTSTHTIHGSEDSACLIARSRARRVSEIYIVAWL